MGERVLRRVRLIRDLTKPAWLVLTLLVVLFVATLGAHSAPADHHGPAVPVDYCLTVVLGSVLLLKAGEALLRQPSPRPIRRRFRPSAVAAVMVPPLGLPYRPPLSTSTTVLRC